MGKIKEYLMSFYCSYDRWRLRRLMKQIRKEVEQETNVSKYPPGPDR